MPLSIGGSGEYRRVMLLEIDRVHRVTLRWCIEGWVHI
jgi:hypothetical protein